MGTSLAPMVAAADLIAGFRPLVVEDAGAIVGHWSLTRLWQAEGLAIAPSHAANPSVGRHLLMGLRELAQDEGAKVIYTGAERGESGEHVRSLLLRAGAMPMNADVFFWPVRPRMGLK